MFNNINNLSDVYLTVGVIVAIVLGVFLIHFVQRKIAEVNVRAADGKYSQIVYQVTDIISDALGAIEVEIEDQVRLALKDGVITQAEYHAIITSLKEKVMRILSEEVQADIIELFGDYDLWIENKIRSLVNSRVKVAQTIEL